MKYGFIKVAAASPELIVADCEFNGKKIIESAMKLADAKVEVAVFPELSITGYSCGDLFYQSTLQSAALSELAHIANETSDLNMLIFVGLPIVQPDGIFDVSAALYRGEVIAMIPKVTSESGANHSVFTSAGFAMDTRFIDIGSFFDVPFGTNILFSDSKDYRISFACEIGCDLMSPMAPSTVHALAGASIILNPFAAPELPGKENVLSTQISAQSGRLCCGYVASGASWCESTGENVFSGRKIIAENGIILAHSEAFSQDAVISDIDVELLTQERLRTAFGRDSELVADDYISVEFDFGFDAPEEMTRHIPANPFPSDCKSIAGIQSRGLARRLSVIHCQNAVIGLSGGLDSTLALLITCQAFDILNLPRTGITAITMPCFGTTDRTYNNACELARECGVTLKEIKIADSVKQHFADIGQNAADHDITYENSQARERTQVLMDYANKVNGIVIGTGDLSELALGWCTYNGDHMSMYGVNSTVPKTLVRSIVDWFATENNSAVLKDILATPVSPELLPPTEGNISQVTEDLVGPYELHDFYLYYILRYGFEPAKILYLAQNSDLGKKYDRETMVKWLKTFYRRFFTQQFKRSCMPDGAAAGVISLSPRGAWSMPSDASGAMWLKAVEKL